MSFPKQVAVASKQRQHFLRMILRVDRIDDVRNLALLIDDERHPVCDADDGLRGGQQPTAANRAIGFPD